MNEANRQFKVTVEGQYHALHTSGNPTLKRYVAEFILPSQEAALSIICKHLLNPYLHKNYPDFIRYRTHELKSIVVVGRAPDPAVLQMSIDEMSMAELSDFCILKQILIDPYKHANLAAARELVQTTWSTKRQRILEKESGKTAQEEKEIAELLQQNKLPPQQDSVGVSVNERKATAAAVRADTPGPKKTSPIEADEQLPPVIDDVPADQII